MAARTRKRTTKAKPAAKPEPTKQEAGKTSTWTCTTAGGEEWAVLSSAVKRVLETDPRDWEEFAPGELKPVCSDVFTVTLLQGWGHFALRFHDARGQKVVTLRPGTDNKALFETLGLWFHKSLCGKAEKASRMAAENTKKPPAAEVEPAK